MKPSSEVASTVPPESRQTQVQRRQRAERRIINAAIRLIAERGLKGLTLGAAGELAGYSRSIASHHFGKKDALLIAICQHITKSFSSSMKEQASKPGLERLLDMVSSYINGVKENSLRIRALHLILTEAVHNPALISALAEINNASVAGIQLQIINAQRQGEINPAADAHANAILILAGLRGLVAQYLIADERFDLDAVRGEFLQHIQRTLSL